MRPLADTQLAALLRVDWLFEASTEPTLIVDAASERIAQLNPAAGSLFKDARALVGGPLIGAFDASSTIEIRRCMGLALRSGSAHSAPLRAESGLPLRARLSLVRTAFHSHLLVRLDCAVSAQHAPADSAVFDAMDSAPVGFLMTDAGLRVEYANQKFLEMLQQEPTSLPGTSLLRWLQLTKADRLQLHYCMSERQAVTLLTAQLFRARTKPWPVAVCAIAVPEGLRTSWGFTVQELQKLN